jgi:hypothetical protein
MKIIVGTLIAFLLGSVVASNDAEARCWWNGYNHCGYHHQVYHHHGYYHHAWNHDYGTADLGLILTNYSERPDAAFRDIPGRF